MLAFPLSWGQTHRMGDRGARQGNGKGQALILLQAGISSIEFESNQTAGSNFLSLDRPQSMARSHCPFIIRRKRQYYHK